MSLIMGPSSRSFFMASHQESVERGMLGLSYTARYFVTRRKDIFDSSTWKSLETFILGFWKISFKLSISFSQQE